MQNKGLWANAWFALRGPDACVALRGPDACVALRGPDAWVTLREVSVGCPTRMIGRVGLTCGGMKGLADASDHDDEGEVDDHGDDEGGGHEDDPAAIVDVFAYAC